jgi:hypothetical protein
MKSKEKEIKKKNSKITPKDKKSTSSASRIDSNYCY